MKYRAVVGLAESVRHGLTEVGARPEDIDAVCSRLTMIAGGLLPPVSGEFRINLDDLRKT